MSSANPTADPANMGALSGYRLIKDFGKNTVADGKVGFQNCPRFCTVIDFSLFLF